MGGQQDLRVETKRLSFTYTVFCSHRKERYFHFGLCTQDIGSEEVDCWLVKEQSCTISVVGLVSIWRSVKVGYDPSSLKRVIDLRWFRRWEASRRWQGI